MNHHIGRSWSGTRLEDDCPCEKASCGLVAIIDDSCSQHSPFAIKTIRQSHAEEDCPGEKMIDPKLQFLTEPDVEAELDQENQKLHNEWMIEHIRANAAEERVRQLEDYIRGEK